MGQGSSGIKLASKKCLKQVACKKFVHLLIQLLETAWIILSDPPSGRVWTHQVDRFHKISQYRSQICFGFDGKGTDVHWQPHPALRIEPKAVGLEVERHASKLFDQTSQIRAV